MRPATYLVAALLYLAAAYLVFRVFVRSEYRRRGRLTALAALLEWLIFIVWGCFTWADWAVRYPSPRTGPLVASLAWICIAVGLLALLCCFAYLGIRRSHGLTVGVLTESGPYRLTRNPQVLACTVAVAGYAMLWPSLHTVGWFLLYAVAVHMMVLTEEEHLRAAHEDAYARYCERVPRYLGMLR
jgi:protein-S-isoprenylcysteine O-methyltransferase Ste14